MQLDGVKLHVQRQTRRLTRWWLGSADRTSGPATARLFWRLFGLLLIVHWISLATQVAVVLGPRGLGPAFSPAGLSLAGAPETILVSLCGCGAFLAALCALGVKPQLALACQLALYLLMSRSGAPLLLQAMDRLLFETMVLVLFLPTERQAAWSHSLLRLFVFKVYFFSGLEKVLAPDGAWLDGLAMASYFESPPLATRVGWLLAQSPLWWHHIETWAVLFIQIVVPWGIFGPRWLRRSAFVILSGHQTLILATSNEGIFSPVLLILHLFLLDDGLIRRGGVWVRRHTRRGAAQLADWLERDQTYADESTSRRQRRRRWLAIAVCTVYLGLSAIVEMARYDAPANVGPAASMIADMGLVNAYSLLAPLRERRVQPQIDVRTGVDDWRTLAFAFAPGPVQRAPEWVAPHQPRVDRAVAAPFAAGAADAPPHWLLRLRDGLCDPGSPLNSVFERFPGDEIRGVRISWWIFDFSTATQRDENGAWWRRQWASSGPEHICAH